MDIPQHLAQKMQNNAELYGAVLQSITEFKPWFDHSKTPFFPEYTDHNWSHVSQTVATAASLIRDEAWPEVTPDDACVLVLAVLLHDCGMHLSEDGFLVLINDKLNKRGVDGWPDESWASLWMEFLSEASRFDSRKLIAIFGDSKPVHPPLPDPGEWTLRDRLLIGEFLRRHHHRLAHEIAINGVPGVKTPPLRLKGVPSDIADLAGLIARSHGMPLRSSIPALSQFDVRAYKGIHAVFLMCVLRIADYLQVQAERAPNQMLLVKKLRSPLSQREWAAHEAIRDIRSTHEDPEAIYVDATPNTAAIFLRLRRLLTGLQGEIDAAWAVLGEVYGRFGTLEGLGLTLRRVRSNLDDPQFAKSVRYIPVAAAFDSSGADLLKLLIQPLYGEKPEIGIRELVQNAVDACRELEDYLQQYAALTKPEFTVQDGDVVISLEDKGKEGRWLEVSDRGFGMTPEVLCQYFLKAGATFRRSDAWRKAHETSEGKSRVLRSGRFGVGVLAAFLIGDELEVSTRHLNVVADRGLTFKATIDTETIELMRCSRPVGTTIRVRITEEAVWRNLTIKNQTWRLDPDTNTYSVRTDGRSWDWYCLSEPKVCRIVMGKRLEQRFSLPSPNSELGPHMHRISRPDYKDIHWSYTDGPFLAANGIIITESPGSSSIRHLRMSSGFPFTCPHVSVFDPDGNLPLILQRTGLTTAKYPFHQELFEDVIRDWLAFLLVCAPGAHISSGRTSEYRRLYSGLERGYGVNWQETSSGQFCCAEGGVYPSDSWNIRQGNFHKFLIASEQITALLKNPLSGETRGSLVIPAFGFIGAQTHRRWTRFALCGDEFDQGFGWLKDFQTSCRRMLLSKDEYEAINRGRIIASSLWNRVAEESSNEDWVVVRFGNCNCREHFDFLAFSNQIPKNAYYPVFIEWHLADSQNSPKELSPLAKLWSEVLPSPLIPYDLNERRSIFAAAFSDLKDLIAGHELSLAEEKTKEQTKASQPDA